MVKWIQLGNFFLKKQVVSPGEKFQDTLYKIWLIENSVLVQTEIYGLRFPKYVMAKPAMYLQSYK